MACQLKYVLGKVVNHQALATINVLDPSSNSRVECTTKLKLEEACLAEMGWQFTQAMDTPFQTHPLKDIFGRMGLIQRHLMRCWQVPLSCPWIVEVMWKKH